MIGWDIHTYSLLRERSRNKTNDIIIISMSYVHIGPCGTRLLEIKKKNSKLQYKEREARNVVLMHGNWKRIQTFPFVTGELTGAVA